MSGSKAICQEARNAGKQLFTFHIPMKLPGMNQYTYACRSHWSKGAKMKQEVEEAIAFCIVKERLKNQKPVTVPCIIYITWFEKTQKRDADNIQSSQKFILDALTGCKIIPDDSRRWVKQIYHEIVDSTSDFVSVRIMEA